MFARYDGVSFSTNSGSDGVGVFHDQTTKTSDMSVRFICSDFELTVSASPECQWDTVYTISSKLGHCRCVYSYSRLCVFIHRCRSKIKTVRMAC
jgi:hypothetical protein